MWGIVLLAVAGAAAPPPQGVAAITGEWLERDVAKAVADGRLAANGGDPVPDTLALMVRRDGDHAQVRITNYHEAMDLDLVAVEALSPDRWRLRVAGGSHDSYDVALERDRDGRVVALRGALWEPGVERTYVRAAEGVAAYVNAHTLEGNYHEARSGIRYEFHRDGTALWDGVAGRYEIVLDPSEAGCSYFTLSTSDADRVEPLRVGFRRDGSQLALYRIVIDDGSGTGYPIDCAKDVWLGLVRD